MSEALTPEAERELREWAERFDDECARDALAEIDRLRAALAARDRQLAELREAVRKAAALIRSQEKHLEPKSIAVRHNRTARGILTALLPTDPNPAKEGNDAAKE